MNAFTPEANCLNDIQEIFLVSWCGFTEFGENSSFEFPEATVCRLIDSAGDVLQDCDFHEFATPRGARKVLKQLARKGLVGRKSKNSFFLLPDGVEAIFEIAERDGWVVPGDRDS